MLHLSSERLAALADSEPAPFEADHLASCATCARERAAHRAVLMMARGEREQLGMPLTRWDSLAPELHRAGLVAAGALMSTPSPAAEPLVPGRLTMRRVAGFLRAAAVVFLVGGGVALGRISAGASPLGAFVEWGSDETVAPTAIDREPFAPPPPRAGVGVVSSEGLVPNFGSVEEARVALERYEVAYQHAARYLAEHDSTMRIDVTDGYRARLAALDEIRRAASEALREAPYDPVINGYYLTTLGQREATLRQLDTSLPEGYRVRSF
jgi:hypothetical protein